MIAHFGPIAHACALANETEKQRLCLSSSSKVLRLERIRSHEGRLRAYERIVLPLSRLPGLEAQQAQSLELSDIARGYGLMLGRATEHLRYIDITPDAALHLGASTEQRVLELDRVTTTTDGVPIEWRVAYMLPDEALS